jgi:hypothetical protein
MRVVEHLRRVVYLCFFVPCRVYHSLRLIACALRIGGCMKMRVTFANCGFAVAWLKKRELWDEPIDELNSMTRLLNVNGVIDGLDKVDRAKLLSYVRVCRKRRDDAVEDGLREHLVLRPTTFKRLMSFWLLVKGEVYEDVTIDDLLNDMIDRCGQ